MRTPEADRFRAECEVPDPPLSPKGRQRYWDETVFEAVAELRKRLRSQDTDEALHALEMIVDLEKTRIRHAAKVSGTHVPVLPDLDDDWGNPLPTTTPANRNPLAYQDYDDEDEEDDAEWYDGCPPVPPLSAGGTGLRAGGLDLGGTGLRAGGPDLGGTGLRAGGPDLGGTGLRAGGPDLGGTGLRAGGVKNTGSEAGATGPEPEPAPSRTPACPAPFVRIPGVTGCFSDRDDDWTRDPGHTPPDDDPEPPTPVPVAFDPALFAVPEPRIWC